MQSKNPIAVFVVNLEDAFDKKQHMERLCKEFGLDCQFIQAVDGSKLSEAMLQQLYSKDAATRHIGREMSRGEIGCALSHKRIYQKMLDEHIETALILEDDVALEKGFNAVVEKFETFPADWECVLLGHHTNRSRQIETDASIWLRKKITKAYSIIRFSERAMGTYGYLLNRRGAKKLLDAMRMIEMPIDHYTGDEQYTNLYGISKPCVTIEETYENVSAITGERAIMQASMKPVEQKYKALKKILKTIGLFSVLKVLWQGMRNMYAKLKIPRRYTRYDT